MFRKRGFTLLELIIVIIVIGILASIALPRYMRVAERARAAEAKSMLSAIRSSQFRYAAQHNNFTATYANLDIESSPEKYFNYSASDGVIKLPGFGIFPIGIATRTSEEIGGLEQYTIAIDEDGDMELTPDTLDYIL